MTTVDSQVMQAWERYELPIEAMEAGLAGNVPRSNIIVSRQAWAIAYGNNPEPLKGGRDVIGAGNRADRRRQDN